MKPTIEEIWQSLREFYPDPQTRHRVHYTFAHRFLPQYVRQNPYAFFSYLFNPNLPGGAMDPRRFLHSRWEMFEINAGLVPDPGNPLRNPTPWRRPTDLTMTIHILGGRPCALVHLPVPEQPVEAHFVGVVLQAQAADVGSWPEDVSARVFTLEAAHHSSPGIAPYGVFCEWTKEGVHNNYGGGCALSSEAFLGLVQAQMEIPSPRSAAQFRPPLPEPPAGNSQTRTASAPDAPAKPAPREPAKPWWKIW